MIWIRIRTHRSLVAYSISLVIRTHSAYTNRAGLPAHTELLSTRETADGLLDGRD